MLAYIQVGIWLRIRRAENDDPRLEKWHNDLSAYVLTPKDFISWEKSDKHSKIKEKNQSQLVFLPWNEIFAPITFQIDLAKLHTQPTAHIDKIMTEPEKPCRTEI